MNPAAPTLSIVIVSFNAVDYLRRCLLALRQHPAAVPMQVIVIDNASTDGNADMVAAEFPEFELIRMPENMGYGVAVNLAVKQAQGALLLLLNPDTEVFAGTLDTLLAFLQSHPKAGIVAPHLVHADGAPMASVRHFLSARRTLFETLRLHLLLPPRRRSDWMLGTYFSYDQTQQVPWVSGACHLIPRTVWNEIGPLTEETFCGFDDYDYCYRVWKHGYEVWFCAEAVMIHQSNISVNQEWGSWGVEQVAAHCSYVVLQAHWSPLHLRTLWLSVLLADLSEVVRDTLAPRREYAKMGEPYRTRLKRRIRFETDLLLGRQQPVKRFRPDSIRPLNHG